MKLSKFPAFLVILSALFTSCLFFKKGPPKETKTETNEAKPIDFKSMTGVAFGWGGGFTGMVEEYYLAKDGNLMKGDELQKKLDNKVLKNVMATVKKVNFTKVKLNDPGNLYYFMAAKAGQNEQRLIWNDQTVLPPEVKAAYDSLITLTR
jgi:hypothetical protein